MWLRTPTPPEKRNAFYRGFNWGYGKVEHAYARLIGFIHKADVVPTLFAPGGQQGMCVQMQSFIGHLRGHAWLACMASRGAAGQVLGTEQVSPIVLARVVYAQQDLGKTGDGAQNLQGLAGQRRQAKHRDAARQQREGRGARELVEALERLAREYGCE